MMGKKTKFDPKALGAGLLQGVQESRTAAEFRRGQLDERLARTEAVLSVSSASSEPQKASSPASSEVDILSKLPLTVSPQYRAFCTVNRYTPGNALEWAVDRIDPNPMNPRVFYDPDSIQRLAVSITSTGLKEPIKATIHGTDPSRLVLSDGERRVRAVKQLGDPTIRVQVEDLQDALHRYLTGYELNTQRDSQTPLDNAVSWQRLLEEKHIATQLELAEKLKVSESEVSMTLSLAKLPRDALASMAERRDIFRLSIAYEVYRYFQAHGLAKTLDLIKKIDDDGLSIKQVRARIRGDAEQTSGSRQRYDQRFVFQSGNLTLGSIKTYGADRVELTLQGLPSDKRDQLYEKIRSLVASVTAQLDATNGGN